MKLAINGLGRIGRLVLRRLMEHPEIEVVGVNDLADTRTLAHLIKHDSVHRTAPFPVRREGEVLLLGDRAIPTFHAARPGEIPFGDLGATLVLECTGQFLPRAEAARHLRGSVRQVLVSGPAPDPDLTVVMGLNHGAVDPARHRVLGCGCSTLNCLAPMVHVLDRAFRVQCGLITSVHSYTNDQRILDLPHPDLRRARAASMNMIPTATPAPEQLGRLFPHLAGRFDGLVVRVPTPDVSLLDLTVMLERDITAEAVHRAFQAAAEGELAGILDLVEEEIVSVDLTGHPASCVFDPFLTRVMTPRYLKVFGWFDNEFAYASRMAELAVHLRSRLEVQP